MAETGIPGITFINSPGLTTQTFDGIPGGMNLALPAMEIDDTEARYIQDVLVDKPGLARRRGPVTAVENIAALSRKGSGLAAALNPQGLVRYAVLTGDDANGYLTVYSADMQSTIDLDWPHPLPADPANNASYRHVDIKPALHGGAWIGVSSAFDADDPNQDLGLWFGGTKADYDTTITVARGKQAVTGTGFTASVDPGMFLFANTDDPYTLAFIGTVKSVDSDTSITLIKPSPYAVTAKSATFQSLRGFAPKVAKGRITVDTNSNIVTGGETKFRSQKIDAGTQLTGTLTNGNAVVTGLSSTAGLVAGMPVTGSNVPSGARVKTVDSTTQVTLSANATGSGSSSLTFKVPWDIYRANDGAWIGTVLSVESETGLTLMANAAIAVSDEAFIALRADANYSLTTTGTTQKAGWITATYADREWYFNNGADFAKTSRGWFSDTSDPEIVDMDDFAGDWLDIISTSNVNEPVRGAMAAYNGLLIFKETETFLIGGSSPTSFSVKKLQDDGTIAIGSIQAYAEGVIWAGREGIYLYDGIQTRNLTAAKLGDYYRELMRTFDPTRYRMWSMIDRDHYMLFIESIQPDVPVVKGNVAATPTRFTLYINLVTGAVGTLTNVDIRGSVIIPGSAGRTAWYLVNGNTTTEQVGKTSVGTGGWDLLAANFKQVRKITLASPAVVSKLSLYARNLTGSNQVLKPVIFADASGSPGALKMVGPEATIPANTAEGWFDLPFASPGVSLNAGTYYIGFIAGDVQGAEFSKDTGTNTRWYDTDLYTDGVSNPFGTATNDGEDISLFATVMPSVAIICDSEALFNKEGVDPITCDGSTAGPDFYVETKKFDGGDGLRLKRYKQLAAWYLAQGDDMNVDVVLGLNNIGQALTSTLPVSGFTWDTLRAQVGSWDDLASQFATWELVLQSVFLPKRVRFQKKNQYLAFRLYQASSAVTRMQLGPFQLGYKLMRPGRI